MTALTAPGPRSTPDVIGKATGDPLRLERVLTWHYNSLPDDAALQGRA